MISRLGKVLFFLLCMGAGGCATIGESEFSCPGRPKGVSCMSASEVYRETDSDAPVGMKTTVRRSKQTAGKTGMTQVSTVLPAVDRPIPIRTPAQVLRVWIAPWEDGKGILRAGGYSFIEVQSRRWNLGETPLEIEPVRFFSIQKATTDKKKEAGAKAPSARTAQANSGERLKPVSSTPSRNEGAPK